MISNSKKLRSQKLNLAVILLYVSFYLCLTFHHHTVNINSSSTHYFQTNHETSQTINSNQYCEICHISNNFNQLPSFNFIVAEFCQPQFDISTPQTFTLLKHTESNHNLRAPPAV